MPSIGTRQLVNQVAPWVGLVWRSAIHCYSWSQHHLKEQAIGVLAICLALHIGLALGLCPPRARALDNGRPDIGLEL